MEKVAANAFRPSSLPGEVLAVVQERGEPRLCGLRVLKCLLVAAAGRVFAFARHMDLNRSPKSAKILKEAGQGIQSDRQR